MRLLAPAKINLHLRVGPPMADGFHPLLTWMSTVGLYDTLDVSAQIAPLQTAPSQAVSLQTAPSPLISFHCDDPHLPTDGRNLVVKAAHLFAETFPDTAPICARLHKEIPAGGGLGGGSSDAATMLVAINRLRGGGDSDEALLPLAARLGSDVPFFLRGPSAVCKGRGEIILPIARPAPRWALLITPPFGVSTPQAYRRFDQMNLGRTENVTLEPDWQAWTKLPAAALLEQLVNDLEAPAFAIAPDLEDLKKHCEQKLARPVRMSGSGSTLFTLYDRRDEAETASQKIKSADLGSLIVCVAPEN